MTSAIRNNAGPYAVYPTAQLYDMSATSNSDDTLTPLYVKEKGVVALLRRHGRLRPLKTCLETQAVTQTVEAHVVEIPTRAAYNVLRYQFPLQVCA